MMTMYERLDADTAADRARFMEVPLIQAVIGSGTASASDSDNSPERIRQAYTRFLIESYYHVRIAAPVYAMAGARVSEDKDDLRRWLMQHAIDEYGHHHWIVDDLNALGFDTSMLERSKPSIHTDSLVAWLYYVAGFYNPIAMLGDAYVIEGLSQLLATQAAETMQGKYGIPSTALTYLARHGHLDQGHMDEFRDVVNSFVTTESDYQDILHSARIEFDTYGRMLAVAWDTQPIRAQVSMAQCA